MSRRWPSSSTAVAFGRMDERVTRRRRHRFSDVPTRVLRGGAAASALEAKREIARIEKILDEAEFHRDEQACRRGTKSVILLQSLFGKAIANLEAARDEISPGKLARYKTGLGRLRKRVQTATDRLFSVCQFTPKGK